MTDRAQILPGTLDLLILKAVSLGPLYGYGILLRIEQISQGRPTDRTRGAVPRSVPSRTSRIAEGPLGQV